MTTRRPGISVVYPVFNEEENISRTSGRSVACGCWGRLPGSKLNGSFSSDLPDCHSRQVCAVVGCSALFGSVPCLWADRLGRAKLQQLNRCSIIKYERNSNSNRWLGRRDQNLPTFEGFVQIVDGEGDVRNNPDNLGHVAMRLEPVHSIP
jgi:hypothetical protein